MDRPTSVKVPIIYTDGKPWFLLNAYSNAGFLRAASMSKPRHIRDSDGHHYEEVSAHTSVRYHPRKWLI